MALLDKRPGHSGRLGIVATALTAFAVVAVFVGQLGLGRWQADEYLLFANQRLWGWHILSERLGYSPRPVSEGILFLYGKAVMAANQPLVRTFLLLLWVGALLALVAAAWGALPRSRNRLVAAAALGFAWFAFALVSGPVTELFYWPMAAAAYLPTAIAAAVLLFLLASPPEPGQRLLCALALLGAAGSSEVGAAFATAFAGAAAVLVLFRRSDWRQGLWWLLPGLLGAADLLVVLHVRVPIVELGAASSAYTGHTLRSLWAGLSAMLVEAAGDGAPWRLGGVLLGLGTAAVLRREGLAPNRWHAALAAALFLALLFSAAAAFDHYGALCCERQEATRLWFDDVLVALAAFLLPAAVLAHRAWLGPATLLIALLLPLSQRVGALRTGYGLLSFAAQARAKSWESGRKPAAEMEFYLPPDAGGALVRGTSLPIDRYDVGPTASIMIRGLGGFFDKRVVFVCQPWQTNRSWIIHGGFIPACPPNGLPPQIVP